MRQPANDEPPPNQLLLLAQRTSSIGAGVLGVGIGALASPWIGRLAGPVLVLGLIMHALGMTTQHRLETNQSSARPWWLAVLYWACWLGLVGILVLVALR